MQGSNTDALEVGECNIHAAHLLPLHNRQRRLPLQQHVFKRNLEPQRLYVPRFEHQPRACMRTSAATGQHGSQHRYLSCAVSCVPLCDLPAQPAWPCARWGATLYSPTCCSCHRTFALGAVRFCMAHGVDVLHASLGTTTRRPPHTCAPPLLYYYCKSVQISSHINTVSGCKAFAVVCAKRSVVALQQTRPAAPRRCKSNRPFGPHAAFSSSCLPRPTAPSCPPFGQTPAAMQTASRFKRFSMLRTAAAAPR